MTPVMQGLLVGAFALGVGCGFWHARAARPLTAVVRATRSALLVVWAGCAALIAAEMAAGVAQRGAAVASEAGGAVLFLACWPLWLCVWAAGPAAAGAVVGVAARKAVRSSGRE